MYRLSVVLLALSTEGFMSLQCDYEAKRDFFSEFVTTTNGQSSMRRALVYNSESILYV